LKEVLQLMDALLEF